MKNAILFDYFEFTIFTESVEFALSKLHLSMDEFSIRCGRNGYKSGLIHNSGKLIVLYDGNEGMGCHFVFSGSCMEFFYSLVSRSFGRDGQHILNFSSASDCFRNWYEGLRKDNLIKVSRLDVAFDFFTKKITVDSTRSMWMIGQVKTNWKKFERIEKCNRFGERLGITDYYGSRMSEVYLRVYDKFLEQGVDNSDIDSWTRFEFVMKNKLATAFLDGFFMSNMEDAYLRGLFYRYFDVDDEFYKLAFEDSSIVNITLPDKGIKNIDTVLSWLKISVAPSLHTLVRVFEGDVSWLYEIISASPPRKDTEFLIASTPA